MAKKLNEYFKTMLEAKKNKKKYFMYKVNKYVGTLNNKLCMIYKKAQSGGGGSCGNKNTISKHTCKKSCKKGCKLGSKKSC